MINTKCSMCASGSSISILIPSVFLGPSFLLSRLLTLSLRSPSSKGAGARLCVACAARLRLPLSPAPCPYLPRERACLRLQLRAGRASGEAAERGHRERRWRVAGSTPRAWHETNHHKKTRACAHAGTHTHTHTHSTVMQVWARNRTSTAGMVGTALLCCRSYKRVGGWCGGANTASEDCIGDVWRRLLRNGARRRRMGPGARVVLA